MGTSQSIHPGVSGEPVWGETSSKISNLANRIIREISSPELTQNPKYQDSKRDSLKKILSSYIKAAGGKGSITSGKSSKGGKAVLSASKSFSGVLNSFANGEFKEYANAKGFSSLINKTKNDLINFLLEDICGPTTNFDEAAAKSALNKLLDKLTEEAETAEDVDEMFSKTINEIGIDEILIEYFGYYIYEHLFQPIQEKLFESKGEEICNKTMDEIEGFIQSELKVVNIKTSLSKIDWNNKNVRENIINTIFTNVIEVFSE